MENKKMAINKACKVLGVSRWNLTYQIRAKVGPLRNIGYYCPPVPGNTRGQYVIYEKTVKKFIEEGGWAE